MKAFVIGIALIALAGFSWAHISVEQEQAVSGCCKQKEGDIWRRIGDDFESCKALNNKEDGDNVFEQSGTYWWDVSC